MGKHRDHFNRTPKITLGKAKFSKIGLPRYDWHDIYHLTLTLSWPVFLAVIGAIFLGVNALFALAYLGRHQRNRECSPRLFWRRVFLQR